VRRPRAKGIAVNWSTTFLRDIPFGDLEARQQAARDAVRLDPSAGVFLVSEPKATYTAGRAADPKGLLWSPETASSHGVSLFQVSRGGQWTFHGPGQIVVYPLVSLKALGYPSKGVRRFLGEMRAGVVDFLAEVGLTADAEDSARPFGIYCQGAKLVSFGIAVERGVSAHGLALYLRDQNVNFQGIHPCGVPGERLASLESLGVLLDWDEAANRLVTCLKNRFTAHKTC